MFRLASQNWNQMIHKFSRDFGEQSLSEDRTFQTFHLTIDGNNVILPTPTTLENMQKGTVSIAFHTPKTLFQLITCKLLAK